MGTHDAKTSKDIATHPGNNTAKEDAESSKSQREEEEDGENSDENPDVENAPEKTAESAAALRASVSEFMAFAHQSVNQVSKAYFEVCENHDNYVIIENCYAIN